MQTVTVTIGRNLNTSQEPMGELEWECFRGEVIDNLKSCIGGNAIATVELHFGTGTWEGIEEESCKITFFLKQAMSKLDRISHNNRLADIAGWYCQDAIAIAYTKSRLIKAS